MRYPFRVEDVKQIMFATVMVSVSSRSQRHEKRFHDWQIEAGPLLTIFNISNSRSGQVCWKKLLFAGRQVGRKQLRDTLEDMGMCWIDLCLVMKVSGFFSLASPNRVRLG